MKRDKQFMLDIESTGVDFQFDSVLEIGIVEMEFTDGYWRALHDFRRRLHYPHPPKSEFAKKHLADLYRACADVEPASPGQIRDEILAFFLACGRQGHEVLIAGWNAANFDVQMLHAKGYLRPPGYETVDGKDRQVGDHHYRIYEMCGAMQLAADVRQTPYDEFKKLAIVCGSGDSAPGKDHDAIDDCYKQIRILNGLISLTRGGV